MKLRKFIDKIRMLATIVVILLLVSIVGSIIYLHNSGLPEPLKLKVIEKLKEKNLHVDFSLLKYKIGEGLVIENPIILDNAISRTPILNAEQLVISIDKTKLLRGVIELDSVMIENGEYSLNPTPKVEDAPMLHFTNINGLFAISNSQQIISKEGVTLDFEGIQIVLKGSAKLTAKKDDDPDLGPNYKLAESIRELKKQLKILKWTSETPPTVTISTDGEISDLKTLQLDFSISAEDLQYKELDLKNIRINGNLDRQLFQVEELSFADAKGKFSAKANLSLPSGETNFQINSSVDLNPFVDTFVKPNQYTSIIKHRGSNNIDATGKIQLPLLKPDGTQVKLDYNVIGNIDLRDIMVQNVDLDYIGTEFSFREDSLFLNKFQALIDESELNGRLLMNKESIKFSSNSSLPPHVFLPLLEGRGFDKILNQLDTSDASLFNISAKGEIDSQDITKWHADGDIYIGSVSYRDTIIDEASLDFDITPSHATYSNLSVDFDHSNWHKQITYGLGERGFARADKITMSLGTNPNKREIKVIGLEAKVWPSPVIHLFDRKAFDTFSKFFLEAPITIGKSDLNFDLNRPEFHVTGSVNLDHARLSGYDLNNTSFDLDLKRGDTSIKNVVSSIDYSPYKKEQQLTKKTDGKFKIKEVSIGVEVGQDRELFILLSGISGTIWPAPATALFSPKGAKNVEKINFTAPIQSKKSNVVLIQNENDWTTVLNLDLASLGYGGIDLKNAKSLITIDEKGTFFDTIDLEVDYTNYVNRHKLGGSKVYKTTAKKVLIRDNDTTILDLKGAFWPGHLASAFNPEVGKTLTNLDFTSAILSEGSDFQFNYGEKNLTKADLSLSSFSYNNIPFSTFNCNLQVDDSNCILSNISTSYSNLGYKMRKTYGGPSSSTIKVKSAKLGLQTDQLSINSLSGTFYPGRLITIFQPEGIEAVEEFRFSSPPTSTTSGVLDLRKNSTKTNLTTSLKGTGYYYNFLDKDIKGTSISSTINTTSNTIRFSNLKSELLNSRKYIAKDTGGVVYPLSGSVSINFAKNTPSYFGSLAINQLSIASIAKTYDFEEINQGAFSTLFQFYGSGSNVKALNTSKPNTFHIYKSNITKIPLLGPFSKVTSAIGKSSNNEELGYTLVKHASSGYSIKNGILHLSNLSAQSSSLNLKGNGTFNLSSDRVDMKFSVSGFKKNIILLELVRPVVSKFPIIQGSMRYKVYGDLDKLKILPDI